MVSDTDETTTATSVEAVEASAAVATVVPSFELKSSAAIASQKLLEMDNLITRSKAVPLSFDSHIVAFITSKLEKLTAAKLRKLAMRCNVTGVDDDKMIGAGRFKKCMRDNLVKRLVQFTLEGGLLKLGAERNKRARK